MLFFYNTGIIFYNLIVRLLATFNTKAKLFTKGRHHLLKQIEQSINSKDQHIWFHFASLGEFEQGRSVLEACSKAFPDKKIVLTFFSPSGYEIRKNYPLAQHIWYLPLDTKKNAKRFIKAVNPAFAVFTKYDFWHHYFKQLNLANIPLYLIAGTFRANQIFFKGYGSFFRNTLKKIDYFFLQDQESELLLKRLGINKALVTGDTRFDRVIENARIIKSIPFIKAFIKDCKVIVCGSTWPPDESILTEAARNYPDIKFIIAPHEVHEERVLRLERTFKKAVRYSKVKDGDLNLEHAQVLIIDNIGMLSSLYPYGYLAYVGGGFGTGLHNTQEPAAYGKSVIVGPDHYKFKEVTEMIALGACVSIKDAADFSKIIDQNILNEQTGAMAKTYIEAKGGATALVMEKLKAWHQ